MAAPGTELTALNGALQPLQLTNDVVLQQAGLHRDDKRALRRQQSCLQAHLQRAPHGCVLQLQHQPLQALHGDNLCSHEAVSLSEDKESEGRSIVVSSASQCMDHHCQGCNWKQY